VIGVDDGSVIASLHARAAAGGEDGCLDPGTGRFVFTALWLAARGACCDSGCRHCPFRTVDS